MCQTTPSDMAGREETERNSWLVGGKLPVSRLGQQRFSVKVISASGTENSKFHLALVNLS